MTKKEKQTTETGKNKDDKSPNVQLISVILTFVVGVLGVLATIYGPVIQKRLSEQSTQTPIVIVATATEKPVTQTPIPTHTVPPGAPTSTPAPPTDTPVPTFTFTAVPPPALGEDWSRGCISSLWQPYSSRGPVDVIIKDGCLSQPVGEFFAGNGRLSFIHESRLSSAEVHGMFAPLPVSDGTVSLYVNLRDLNTSDIWVGVFSAPSIDARGLLMTIPSGSVSARPLVAWQMPGPKKITTTQTLNQGLGYGVRFEFTTGSVRAVVLPNVFATTTFPVPSAEKWIFIGYQARNGTNRIDASFFDLVIAP